MIHFDEVDEYSNDYCKRVINKYVDDNNDDLGGNDGSDDNSTFT